MKKILLNIAFFVLLIFTRGCVMVPGVTIDQYGNLVQDVYTTSYNDTRQYPIEYNGIVTSGPFGAPWLGLGTPWMIDKGQWYHDGRPYALYCVNGQYGWWELGYYPEQYRVFRYRRQIFPYGGYYNNYRVIYRGY